jgi:hypothetical protein
VLLLIVRQWCLLMRNTWKIKHLVIKTPHPGSFLSNVFLFHCSHVPPCLQTTKVLEAIVLQSQNTLGSIIYMAIPRKSDFLIMQLVTYSRSKYKHVNQKFFGWLVKKMMKNSYPSLQTESSSFPSSFYWIISLCFSSRRFYHIYVNQQIAFSDSISWKNFEGTNIMFLKMNYSQWH